MIEISITAEFEKRYNKLSVLIQKKAERQQEKFQQDPFYPSLHTEKIQPKSKQVWSFRIDRKYRIFFRFLEKNEVLFLTVGPHDWVYNMDF